jgi:AraC-like DNA-binding protein
MENSVQIISQKLGQDPDYLATIFAEVKGFTLIQFVDSHRIEKIKELLLYDQLSLELIAERLNYANVAELRGHFKKATGLAPSFFYELGKKRRALYPTV